MNENICAISTALGVGAISIVRCSGPDVISIVNKIFKGTNLENVSSHTIHYGHIVDGYDVIDEVLVSVMRAPKTFTKEDVVEINCHGGISTTNKVLELLLVSGCRMATPGEFTKKAFLNGRIDLTEAEGIQELISSEGEEARKYAMNKVEGNLKKIIKSIREKLVNLSAILEVNYDYPEETDNPEMTYDLLSTKLKDIDTSLKSLVSSTENVQFVSNGIDLAIIGKPNVGKSSILNHLTNENKAIVTSIAGTTRDVVYGSIFLNGVKFNLIDTAGIRESDDLVEQIGVTRSKEAIMSSDLVVFVLNNNEPITQEELDVINTETSAKKIIFINKCDLEEKINLDKLNNYTICYGNTVEANGLDSLKQTIIELFNLDELKSKNYNYLSNARHIALVKEAVSAVENGIESAENGLPFEMISVDINEAYDLLGEIIGAVYKDELLDTLFSKFCLGK